MYKLKAYVHNHMHSAPVGHVAQITQEILPKCKNDLLQVARLAHCLQVLQPLLQELLVIEPGLTLPLCCGAFLALALQLHQFLDSMAPGGKMSCIFHDKAKLLLPPQRWILHLLDLLLELVEADNE